MTLDTDLLTLLQWVGSSEERRLSERLELLRDGDVTTTVVSYEEQTRGRLAVLSRARTVRDQVIAYDKLVRNLEFFRALRVLPFDARAAVTYQDFRVSTPRGGSIDLKIAAIAVANGATLLTRNIADFRGLPGLLVEDWTT